MLLTSNEETTKPNSDIYSLSTAITIMISLLFIILLISYYLQLKKIRFIHETVVSIMLGAVVGLIVSISSGKLEDLVTFNEGYFFSLLLPPIILNSGYDLKTNHFFRNIGLIMTFAFLGTFISTILLGVMIYMVALTRIHGLSMSFIDCLTFGAILSSTDPVTILSIFHQMGVEPKLYAIIFGESILNDSVAIVLSASLSRLRGQELSLFTLVGGIVSFFIEFTESVMLGVILALLCALMLKHLNLYQFPSIETCLILLIAYLSYLFSTAIKLSGIVSLLFCSMAMKHYCYHNMSLRTRRTTKYMFRVLSQLSENFIFIYLGISLFTLHDGYYPGLIFFTLIFIVLARYASTIPLARLINFIHSKFNASSPEPIPKNHQLMIFWAGLRGAIAFAFSFGLDIKDSNTMHAIKSTTLVVCVVSIVVLGGTTHLAIDHLKIKTGYGHSNEKRPDFTKEIEQTDSSDEGENNLIHESEDELPFRSSLESNRDGYASGMARALRNLPDAAHWFLNFDNQYMKPIFTRSLRLQSRNSSPTRESLLAPLPFQDSVDNLVKKKLKKPKTGSLSTEKKRTPSSQPSHSSSFIDLPEQYRSEEESKK